MICENKDCNNDGKGGWLLSSPVTCPECKTTQVKCHCPICEKMMWELKKIEHVGSSIEG